MFYIIGLIIFIIGLIIFSIAVGHAVGAATGFMVMGGGLMAVGLVNYLIGPRE